MDTYPGSTGIMLTQVVVLIDDDAYISLSVALIAGEVGKCV